MIFNANHPTLLHKMFYRLLIPSTAARATFTASVRGKAKSSSFSLPASWDDLDARGFLGDPSSLPGAPSPPGGGGRTCFTGTVCGVITSPEGSSTARSSPLQRGTAGNSDKKIGANAHFSHSLSRAKVIKENLYSGVFFQTTNLLKPRLFPAWVPCRQAGYPLGIQLFSCHRHFCTKA